MGYFQRVCLSYYNGFVLFGYLCLGVDLLVEGRSKALRGVLLVNENELAIIVKRMIAPLIIVFCMSVGYIIKTSLDFIDNKYIPLILAVIGVVFNAWQNEWEITPEIISSGIVSGLASVGAFEMLRNLYHV